MLLLTLVLALVPVLNWKRTPLAAIKPLITVQLGIAAVAMLVVWYVVDGSSLWLAVALIAGGWLALTHIIDLFRRLRLGRSLPLAYVGMVCAHLGMAMSVIGIAVTSTLSVEMDVRMSPQSQQTLAGYEVTFLGVSEVAGPNYVAQRGEFVAKDGSMVLVLAPEKRRYLAGGSIMTEAGISPGFFADTYISLGEPLDAGAWAVRLHYKPLVRWVWLGALLMALGGVTAVLDKRYRRLRRRDQVPATTSTAASTP